jgi:hypothetical protein
MKILGKEYEGDCLKLSIPLDVKDSVLDKLKTTGQKVSALYWLEFWRAAVDRAIILNTNNQRPIEELKKTESEYSRMIQELKEGLKQSSVKSA